MYPSFDKLKGKRVLVTRASHDGAREIAALKEAGAEPIHIPLVEACPPSDGYSGLDSAIKRLQEFSWIIFTSRRSVRAFFRRLDGRQMPKTLRIAAIGPSTEKELLGWNIIVSLVPSTVRGAEGLLDILLKHVQPGERILFPRAKEGLDKIPLGLMARGILCDVVEAYRVCIPAGVERERLLLEIESNTLNAILFASPSAVKNFVEIVGKKNSSEFTSSADVYAIGPSTQSCIDVELGSIRHPA